MADQATVQLYPKLIPILSRINHELLIAKINIDTPPRLISNSIQDQIINLRKIINYKFA